MDTDRLKKTQRRRPRAESRWQEHSAHGSDTRLPHVTHAALNKRRDRASFKKVLTGLWSPVEGGVGGSLEKTGAI